MRPGGVRSAVRSNRPTKAINMPGWLQTRPLPDGAGVEPTKNKATHTLMEEYAQWN